jgi:16S rRNA processing protein RimM
MDAAQTLVVGRITGLYGVRGWVRVRSHTQNRADILGLTPWMLKLNGEWRECTLESSRAQGHLVLAQIAGYGDRDAARALIGADIAVHRAQLPELGADEYYWADFIGMRVVDRTGRVLGQVAKLLETGAHDVLVVHGEKETLIPYVPGLYVLAVSPEERLITVDWTEAEDG